MKLASRVDETHPDGAADDDVAIVVAEHGARSNGWSHARNHEAQWLLLA
jgi:hypothetical protein